MLDHHSLTIGGVMTAHAATRISEAIADCLDDSYGEGELELVLPDCGNATERFVPDGETPTAAMIRPYLLTCIQLGCPAHFGMEGCSWEYGASKIDNLDHLASDLLLSGRLVIGTHWDQNHGRGGSFIWAWAKIFGPDAPCEDHYNLGEGYEPAIAITPDLDLRSLPREAARLRMLSEWRPPILQAHADLRAELAGFQLAA